jgi:hypothetical protein
MPFQNPKNHWFSLQTAMTKKYCPFVCALLFEGFDQDHGLKATLNSSTTTFMNIDP